MGQVFFQGSSLYEFCHNVDIALSLDHVLQVKDIGVRHHPQGLDFVAEESSSGLITESSHVDVFDGHWGP